jgi:hypothetical protein
MRHTAAIVCLVAAGCGSGSGTSPQEFEGSGSENPPTFDAAADWIVTWEHKGSRRAKSAVLIVGPIREVFALSIYREGARDASDFHAIACPPGGPERGEFRVKEAGRFYLGINAIHDVRWTVNIAPAP